MLTEVAPVVCHDKVDGLPETILVGLAVKLSITGRAAPTLTVTVAVELPLGLIAVSV
jgi:hypothetical protein